MKKILKTFVIAVCMLLPCLFGLTACGEKAKVLSFSIEMENETYVLENDTIKVSYGEDYNEILQNLKVVVEYSNEKTKDYDYSTARKKGFVFESNIPNGQVTPVATYTISIGHKDVEETQTYFLVVEKKAFDVSTLNWSAKELCYNGKDQSVTITNLPEDILSVTYSDNTAKTPNEDGSDKEYIATATFTVINSNYKLLEETITHKFTMKQGTLNIPTPIMQTFTYDGSEKNVQVSNALDFLNYDVDYDDSKQGYNAKATDAGEYKIQVEIEYIGDDANYYKTESRSLSVECDWKISPKEISSYIVGILEKTYNGLEQSLEIDLGEDINMLNEIFDMTYTGTKTAKDAGTYSLHIVRRILNNNKNYCFLYETEEEINDISWKILPATLTVEMSGDFDYATFMDEIEIKYSGFVNGEELDDTILDKEELTCKYFDSEGNEYSENLIESGIYKTQISGIKAKNYQIVYKEGTVTIKKINVAPLTVEELYIFSEIGEVDSYYEGGEWKTYLYETSREINISIMGRILTPSHVMADLVTIEYKIGSGNWQNNYIQYNYSGQDRTVIKVKISISNKNFAYTTQTFDLVVYQKNASSGLSFCIDEAGLGYYVDGIGTCTDTKIYIPDTYNSVSVIGIYENAFIGNTTIEEVYLGNCESIGEYAFKGCSALKTVVYEGFITEFKASAMEGCSSLENISVAISIDLWEGITKNDDWNKNTGDYTITCIGGKLSKDGAVIDS